MCFQAPTRSIAAMRRWLARCASEVDVGHLPALARQGGGLPSSALRSMSLNSSASTSCTSGPIAMAAPVVSAGAARRRGRWRWTRRVATTCTSAAWRVLRRLRCKGCGGFDRHPAGFGRAAIARCGARGAACVRSGRLATGRGSAMRVLAACSRMNCMMFSGLPCGRPASVAVAGRRRRLRSGSTQPRTKEPRAAQQTVARNIMVSLPTNTRDWTPYRLRRRDLSLAQLRNCWRNSVAGIPGRVTDVALSYY